MSQSVKSIATLILITLSLWVGGYLFFSSSLSIELALILAQKCLPGTLSLSEAEGSLRDHVHIRNMTYQDNEFTLSAKTVDLKLSLFSIFQDKSPFQSINAEHVSFNWQHDKAIVTATGHLDHHWHVNWTAHIPQINALNPDIHGTATAKGTIDGLLFTPIIHTNVSVKTVEHPDINADILAKARLIGGIRHARIRIDGALKQSNIDIPAFNAHLKNVSITASYLAKQLHYYAQAQTSTPKTSQSKDGTLALTGMTDFRRAKPVTTLHLSGHDAMLVDSSALQLSANPDLAFSIKGHSIALTGNIHIPNAHIRGSNFKKSNTLPDDVVIIKDDTPKTSKEAAKPRYQLHSDLMLTLGQDVTINTFGIKANLTGKLRIQDKPNQSTTAQGQLVVEQGQYEMYGTTLKITRGKLTYTGGPVDNPNLNIRAIRHFTQNGTFGGNDFNGKSLTTGIDVKGTLKKPVIALFSDPPQRRQSDTLSYLLTGQPLGQASTDQSKLLFQAATSLDLGGGNTLGALRKDIKQRFGLAELDIESQSKLDANSHRTTQHTALILGKFLSPRLYVKTSFDIFDHTPSLNVRYSLGKHWSVQSDSSTSGSGVDLLYTIERK